MNLFETIQLIQTTAKESVEQKLIDVPNNPEKRLLIGSGKHELIDTPFVAPPRKHTVETIEAFAEAYARWSLDGSETGPTDTEESRLPNVWLDLAKWRLMFYADEPLRRSSVTLKLTAAPQWATVSKFRDALKLEQKSLVRLLRHDLGGCVDAGVLAAFRTIDFQKINNAKRTIEHGKQSLDADIVAQVSGERKPEEIVVVFPVLISRELPDFRGRVVLTVDIDADEQRFTLQARPGELDLVLEELKGVVSATLESALTAAGASDVTILAGSPE